MIDVVIPLTASDVNKNIELRYTLRGIEKHLRYVDKVIIVGECPGWVANVMHLPYKEYDTSDKCREKNIFLKVLHALRYTGNEFLFMNDDHFLLQDFNADIFPEYYSGTLEEKLEAAWGTSYANAILNTIGLVGDGKLNYDTHCPMILNEDTLMSMLRFWVKPYGYLLKTFHQYWQSDLQLGSHHINDIKILKPLQAKEITERIHLSPFFSTSDAAINDAMLEVLQGLYPTKSVFEA